MLRFEGQIGEYCVVRERLLVLELLHNTPINFLNKKESFRDNLAVCTVTTGLSSVTGADKCK